MNVDGVALVPPEAVALVHALLAAELRDAHDALQIEHGLADVVAGLAEVGREDRREALRQRRSDRAWCRRTSPCIEIRTARLP